MIDASRAGSIQTEAAAEAPRELSDLVSTGRALLHRAGLASAVAIAAGTAAVAWSSPTVVRTAGFVAVLAMVAAVVIDHDRSAVPGRFLALAGLSVLTVADAGLADVGPLTMASASTLWRPVLAIAAYPILGRAVLEVIGRHRQVRATDVVVEAVLIGAAAAIALQLVVSRLSSATEGWDPAGAAFVSLLAGLDVALVVLVARSLTSEATRRAPIFIIGGASAALFVGHLLAALRLTGLVTTPLATTAPIALGLVAFGAATVLDVMRARPPAVPAEAPLFSSAHAGIVVVAVVAAPAVLTAQVVWGVAVSGSVAVGAGLIGSVLGIHIVSLLQERADSEHQATHDVLTDLPNRLLFMDRLERALAHAQRNGAPVGVLYIDLDRFKDVNDTFGHDAGDQLLREMAARLATSARHEDTVARLAGDEFAVLLPHLAAADDVLIVANRVLAALRRPIDLADHSIHGGASIGVAVSPHDGSTPAELVNAADAAMYRAKDRGGAVVEVFSAALHEKATTRLELETALRQAIADDELVLYYQPIVEVAGGRTCGAEALVRWNHPERGMVPPNDFIPVAELSDLIIDLGEWVIDAACRQLAEWSLEGENDRFVTINVSPRHFRQDLASSIAASLRETGVDPGRLVVELTENAAVEDVVEVAERLRELRQLGVKAAIDDFGTGYCGLQYLGELPVSTLKLDRSFVQSMTPSSAAVVAATIAMSRSLGMTLVVEGVETEEQRRFLEAHGCDRMQGFFLGRPMPASDFLARVQAEDRADADARLEEAMAGVFEAGTEVPSDLAAEIVPSVAEPAQG